MCECAGYKLPGSYLQQQGVCRGGQSIYGEKFADEGFTHKHDKPYLLSMANAGALLGFCRARLRIRAFCWLLHFATLGSSSAE